MAAQRRIGNLVAIGVAVVLLVAGGFLVVRALLPSEPPAPPLASTSGPAPSRSPSASASGAGAAGQAALPRSEPVSLSAPTIGVRTSLMKLDLNTDRTVQVPPLTKDAPAGWYRRSPTPGQLGPAIILGHVDTAKYGAAVFYKLGQLAVGDTVSITRADRRTVRFRVDEVARYPKAQFPSAKVYGNIDRPGLRLITCGGQFDFAGNTYKDNTVVFASMVRR